MASATGFEGWIHKEGWLTDAPVCDWDLVGCDSAGRVKLLTLDFNGLVGTLPSSIGDLGQLQDLDMEGNALHGTLPAALGELKELRQIGLGGGSRFEGALPAALSCGPLTAIRAAAEAAGSEQLPCDLGGSNFSCPLPCAEAAKACGAVCR